MPTKRTEKKGNYEKNDKNKNAYDAIMNWLRIERNVYLLFLLTCFILYINTIKNDYSLDDIYVTNNEQVKEGIKAIPKIFKSLYVTNVFEEGEVMNFGYRPVVKATFAIEYALFGENPHVSHLISLMIYFFTILSLYILLKKLFADYHYLFPVIVSLIFLIHPLHTEVVSSLKNRDELLSFFFSLLSLLFFLKFSQKGSYLNFLIAFLFFTIAYLSKISAIVFVALIPFIIFWIPEVKRKRILFVFISLLVIVILIKLATSNLFGPRFRPKHFEENPLLYLSVFERIPTALYILLFYLKILFYPVPMRFYYGYNMITVQDWESSISWIALIIYVGMVFIAIYYFQKKKWLFFSIFIYLICISMYTNVFRPAMGIVADRFLYAPSLGFSIFFTSLLFILSGMKPDMTIHVLKRGRKLYLLVFLIFLFASSKVIDRNKDWKNQESLIENDIKYLENSARANFIYAGMLKNKVLNEVTKTGNYTSTHQLLIEKSMGYYQQALKVYPQYYQAWNMLGSVYFTFNKDFNKAKHCFRKAIHINPNYAPAYSNLAFVELKTGDTIQSEKLYLEAIKLRPGNIVYYIDLAELYKNKGDSLNYQKLSKKANELKQLKK